jgi:hypothetical protein
MFLYLTRIYRLLGILRDCPGFAELRQSRDTPLVAEPLYKAAGKPHFSAASAIEI